jgi:hypothetical protein
MVFEEKTSSQVTWHLNVIPKFNRQEDLKFKASLGYIVRLLSKKNFKF